MRGNSQYGMMLCVFLLQAADFSASNPAVISGAGPRPVALGADESLSQSRSNRRQFAQWAYQCITPYGWCQLYQPLPYGSSCYCPSAYGPVWGIAQ